MHISERVCMKCPQGTWIGACITNHGLGYGKPVNVRITLYIPSRWHHMQWCTRVFKEGIMVDRRNYSGELKGNYPSAPKNAKRSSNACGRWVQGNHSKHGNLSPPPLQRKKKKCKKTTNKGTNRMLPRARIVVTTSIFESWRGGLSLEFLQRLALKGLERFFNLVQICRVGEG